jgi:hypothetical protein
MALTHSLQVFLISDPVPTDTGAVSRLILKHGDPLMDAQIYIDLARFAHIITVAVGFGAAFLTDMHAVTRLSGTIDKSFLSTLRNFHTTIAISVVAMWITGLLMVFIRTGFDVSLFSPKLISKLVIVSILTLNAIVIGKFIMPILEDSVGQSLLWLPFPTQLMLAGVGAISTSSWLLALLLGSSKVLAVSGPMVYAASLLSAAGAVVLLQRLRRGIAPRRPQPVPTAPLSFDMSVARAFRSASRA